MPKRAQPSAPAPPAAAPSASAPPSKRSRASGVTAAPLSSSSAAAAPTGPAPLSLDGLVYTTLRGAGGAGAGVFLHHGGASADGRQLLVLFADAASAAALDDAALASAFAGCGGAPAPARTRRPQLVGDATLLSAVVRFASSSAAAAALGAVGSERGPAVASARGGGGLRAWLTALEGERVDARVLQRAVDGAMAAFDETQAARSAAVASLASRMQADGFTLVTKGRKPRLEDEEAPGEEEGAEGELETDAERRKRKRGGLIKADFYKFQKQAKKLDTMASRQAGFEADRERIRRIKESRVFKPY